MAQHQQHYQQQYKQTRRPARSGRTAGPKNDHGNRELLSFVTAIVQAEGGITIPNVPLPSGGEADLISIGKHGGVNTYRLVSKPSRLSFVSAVSGLGERDFLVMNEATFTACRDKLPKRLGVLVKGPGGMQIVKSPTRRSMGDPAGTYLYILRALHQQCGSSLDGSLKRRIQELESSLRKAEEQRDSYREKSDAARRELERLRGGK